MIVTYKFRLKDKHASELNRQARAVNFVWNYCNETQQKAVRHNRSWLTAYDLINLTSGAADLLQISAQTICQVCIQYAGSRRRTRRPWLKFRGRKTLGWIPVHAESLTCRNGAFIFRKVRYASMGGRKLPAVAKIVSGSNFAQDAKGHWYLNIAVEIDPVPQTRIAGAVGLDLGLAALATLSTGSFIESPRCYYALEKSLGCAKRAKKKKLARNISMKIGNIRRDYLHKESLKLVTSFSTIVVGNVSGAKLAKTRMAKSVLDAGWSTLRKQLSYKSMRNGGTYIEVDERMTTQVCSDCGAVGGPKGIAGLRIREWTCGDCGATHDRDVNAARNILRLGLETLAEGAAKMRSSHQPQEGGE